MAIYCINKALIKLVRPLSSKLIPFLAGMTVTFVFLFYQSGADSWKLEKDFRKLTHKVLKNTSSYLTKFKLTSSHYRVNSIYAHVRLGPGKEFNIKQVLPRSHVIKVLEKKGEWVRFGKDKWVSMNNLSDISSSIKDFIRL